MQALAIPPQYIQPLKAYQFWMLVLEACRDVTSGADRHLLFADS